MPWEKNFNIDDVLDRAMRAFWSRGYAATSMQDLVDCTGVNRASLYATYGDKRALFLAALRKYIGEHCRHEIEVLETEPSPRRAIEKMFRFLFEKEMAAGNNGCFVTNTALELSAHDSEVAAIIAGAQSEFEGFFRRMIERGQAAGEFDAGISAKEMARALLSSFIGLAVLSRSRRDPRIVNTVVKAALAQLE